VPNVLINGKSIGGGDDVGELDTLFSIFLRMFGRARRAGLGGRSDWNGQGSDLAALKPDRAVYRVHVLAIDQEEPKQRIEQTSHFQLSIFARTLCFTIPSR
jgi:hypothetical protein